MIEMNNIQKSYGKQKVLNDINVKFPKGETTVIIGPSGSGKSTLLRSIDLLVRPDSGIIKFPDLEVDYSNPISKQKRSNLINKTSMVFQNWNLFPHLNVIDNITIAPINVQKVKKDVAIKKAYDLLRKVDLESYANRYPSELSGGQQQRISICRALAVQPEYILLDEPTSALDPELESQVLKLLKELGEQKQSIIMITHNMDFAKSAADNILFIEDGKVQFQGKKDEFFNNPNERIKEFLNGISII
ncbi:ATP-binding cassette domain-containing protein [Lactobacillus sp. S2-2]|uniref:amino acid ABC transporter ATP-binding protein n=1 Tax=Lactobacillus sp. S2-2 TaxID=2692917 RepID=UPI001F243971|nr:amino acid ABC transporter ATP-binding protein [Lactobacillus sp. S2-2]MCF6515187.1 ATP-binding cassette domain-containing protein [Lactobacillus sp. S2-2]